MPGLAEIAAAAGVSISTVSRVLNRRDGVNDATRKRVLAVLAELPYNPRGVGALQRTGVIALLVPELSNPIFPAFAEALETRATRRGYSSLLCNTRSASMREEGYVRMLLARGVQGMVFVSPECSDTAASHEHYRTLVAEGVHMVFVNASLPALEIPSVSVDEQVAGYAATRHLLQLGHRRIGFVAGPSRSLPSRAKAAGWQLALEEAELAADTALVAHAPYGAAGGAAAAGRLLAQPDPPSAVICSSDLMAIGAVSEARRRGLRVPEELSVVGFDDIPMAQYVTPALTTLAQPITEIARAAIDVLLTALEGSGPSGAHSRVFRPRLVVRDSTAPYQGGM